MGAENSKDIVVYVKTGDFKKAGISASIKLILHGNDGEISEELVLKNYFSFDFDRGQLNTFLFPIDKLGTLQRQTSLSHIEIWKEDFGGPSAWLVDTISIVNVATNHVFVFPVFRWLKGDRRYKVAHLDTSLPQFEMFKDQRKKELVDKCKLYEYEVNMDAGFVSTKRMPQDERFSFDYKFGLMQVKMKSNIFVKSKCIIYRKWNSFDDMNKLFDPILHTKPECTEVWNDDTHFGMQRLIGVNHAVISLVTNIPDKFSVTDEILQPLLEGLTIQEAIQQKRLFICDYHILEGIPTKENYIVCAPIGLFFMNNSQHLVPVAIQLFQKPCSSNPIFTPNDPSMLWTLVKIWFNNADACHHQAITHVGLTHFRMEGINIAVNRHLSPSHPVYKLLAPHFLYLIAINTHALEKLIPDGMWLSKVLNCGSIGVLALVKKVMNEWRMDVDGDLIENMKKRGLDDPNVLPCFHYRDDGILLYNAIRKYVKAYVDIYYTSNSLLSKDHEIQNWVKNLSEEPDKGVGLKGVPGNGELTNNDQLAQIVTCIIYTCSVAHAAANFGQYDQYGYPPNYPGLVKGVPPSSKTTDIDEKDIVKVLPNPSEMFSVGLLGRILSMRGTNSLGDFEVQYVYDPKAKVVVDRFRKDLKEISETIKKRNSERRFPYKYLDPECIPNSISI